MNDMILHETDRVQWTLPVLPGARQGIRIRPGVLGDVGFIDRLQKLHNKAVGFMFEGAIKGHIAKGNVLVAEAMGVGDWGLGVGEEDSGCARTAGKMPTPPKATTGKMPTPPKATTGGTPIPPQGMAPTPNPQHPTPIGYLIGVDRYLKRDELGIIYQLNVAPGMQRGLVGANLLKAQFERSAYGCRLYCCWCAQDLSANKFWEAMGFVPLAFRTGGGRRKGFDEQGKFRGRMHIFWQKRIREGDSETPYWFPSMTNAGAMGEDRIVLPIPPGTHWSDAKPVVLPEGPAVGEEVKMLESEVGRLEKAVKEKGEGEGRGSRQGKGARDKKGGRGQGSGDREKGKGKAVPRVQLVQFGGLRFGTHAAAGAGQGSVDAARQDKDAAAELAKQLKLARKKLGQMKKKFDPVQEAFARELKDRWLEEVAARPGMLAPARAKYEVTRGAPGISPGSPGSPGSQGSQGSPEFILPGFAPSSEPCTSSLGSSAVA